MANRTEIRNLKVTIGFSWSNRVEKCSLYIYHVTLKFRVLHLRCKFLGWVDTHHGVSTEEAEEKPEVQAPVEEDDDDEICDMEDFEDDDDLVIRKFLLALVP